jgi:uncharacterized RDD family membrane protein YckC
MTRDEQLEFCNICLHQKISLNQGIICRLTNRIAEFDGTCPSFEEDTELSKRLKRSDTGNSGVIASQAKRLVNYFIDILFFYLLCLILGGILGIIGTMGSPSAISLLNDDKDWRLSLIAIILLFIYYVLMEGSTGRTIGKYITKTKVVNEKGEIPGFKTIFLRSLCRFIPFEAFSFLGQNSLGWHDTISKTKVVGI